jgi:hypothetical protein
MITSNQVARAVRVTTQKANKTEYHEVNISSLYSINYFNLIQKQNLFKES